MNKDISDSLRKSFSPDEKSKLWTLGGTIDSIKDDPKLAKDEQTEAAEYTVTLVGVKYDKRVFSPCEAVLTFTATKKAPTPPKEKTTNTAFSKLLKEHYNKKNWYIDVVGFKGTGVDDKTGMEKAVYIARNYYLHSMSVGPNPNSSSSSSYVFKFKCFSLDYKLTLDSYCQVYQGKALSSGLCADKLSKDWAVIKTELEHVATSEYDALKKEYDKKKTGPEPVKRNVSLYDCSVGRLVLLGYSTDSKSKFTRVKKKEKTEKLAHTGELKQPYLVQYNESFYDFLKRTCHRCGEFLYFEDGKLCIGLPPETVKVLDKGKTEATSWSTYSDKAPICTYGDIPLSAESVRTVDSFSRDCVKSPSGIYSGKDVAYDASQTSDEYLYVPKAGDESMDGFGMWYFYTFFDTYFKVPVFMEALVTALLQGIIVNAVMAFSWYEYKVKGYFLEKYVYNPDDSEAKGPAPDSTFGADLPYNICSQFYRQVEKWEESSGRKTVTMSFSNYLPKLYLARAIKLDDGVEDSYVISRMHGEYTTSSTENYAEAVPILTANYPNALGENTAVAVPPPGVSHIRTVSPMEAEVAANDDPMRIGRVRVKYPWQKDQNIKSPWIRITVPFTGTANAAAGFLMVPDAGEHVMLNFIGGNVERPYVDGSMYYVGNRPTVGADFAPEHTLYRPRKKLRVIASGNGHNITFSDGNDTNFWEHVFPPLKPIFNIAAGNVKAVKETGNVKSLGGAFAVKGGSVAISDGTGLCTVGIYPGQRKILLDSRFGNVEIDAFTGITLSAPHGDVNIVGKNVNIKAGNNVSIQSGTNITREDDGREKLGVLLGTILGKVATKAIKATAGVDFEKCCDFTFLRCVVDSFLRPVEGTLTLKSNRNTVMTTGGGKVVIPVDYLARTSKLTTSGWKAFNVLEGEKRDKKAADDKVKPYFNMMKEAINAISTYCDAYFKALCDTFSDLGSKLDSAYNAFTSQKELIETAQKKMDKQTFFLKIIGVDKKGKNSPITWAWLFNGKENDEGVANVQEKKQYLDDLCKIVIEFLSSYQYLINSKKEGLETLIKELNGLSQVNDLLGNDSLKHTVCLEYQSIYLVNYDTTDFLKMSSDLANERSIYKRAIILQLIYRMMAKDGSRITVLESKDGKLVKPEAPPATFGIFWDTWKDAVSDGRKWYELIARLAETDPDADSREVRRVKSFAASFAGSFGNIYDYKNGKDTPFSDMRSIFNYDGAAGPRAGLDCKGEGEGTLFISNRGGYSCWLNDSSGWETVQNSPVFPPIKVLLSGI